MNEKIDKTKKRKLSKSRWLVIIRQPLKPEQPQMNKKVFTSLDFNVIGGFTDAYTFMLYG